jgi:two-component system, chemotaxis family, sensor kinase CheA
MDIDRAALMRLFLSDSEEDLGRLETQVLALEDHPDDAATVDAMFRLAHTLKGNASILALDGFSRFAHTLEDLLHAVRSRRTPVTSDLVTLLLRAVDALRGMLMSLRAGEQENLAPHKPVEDDLSEWIARAKHEEAPGRDAEAAAATAAPAPEEARAPAVEEQWGPAVRIEMAKVDQLLDLASRALVVQGQMGVGLLEAAATNSDLMELQQKGERLLLELQDWIIDTRMIPVSTFFRTHARTVRDAARAQRKRARLRIEGERVRVDTGIGEGARDVLTHLVRNAIDHGIEAPAVRTAKGKDPEGTVTLRAAQNGNQVVIQVADDGAGFNLSKIRARARMLGRANVDSLATQDLHQMVFEAGFSTAEKVTELSGRGVGMDVVRRNVEDLHGTVEIESIEGQGTTVELRLPLSLSVIEGFWIDVAGTEYVLPLDDVIECLELTPYRRTVAEREGIINVHGEPLAYVDLRDLLDTANEAGAVAQIVVVRYRAGRVALGVGAILGERQTVIKPLGRLFRSVAGISGSTIRRDGGVAFVIDVARLLRSVARQGAVGVLSETTAIRGPGEF